MKFKLLSDLHLEFYRRYRGDMLPVQDAFRPTKADDDGETILLLAGDIDTGVNAFPFIEEMCERFYHVLYIAGNHEFYGHEINEVKKLWKEWTGPENFNFLDNEVWYHANPNIRVFGGTMWTHINDPHLIWQAKLRMADYNTILLRDKVGKPRTITVADTNKEFIDFKNKLIHELEKPYRGKTIVMTHHLPHVKCVHPRFNKNPLNPFFMQPMDDVIENYDIGVWCHGHTHDNVDTTVGNTRIYCNPMGYHGVALNNHFNEDFMFWVGQ